jgi:ABC-2 type transport system ATP-binding protein
MKIANNKRNNRNGNDGHTVIVKNLTREFGSFTAVSNADFSVKRGEIFGFLGPNGAGKSTTIKMLCGILKPTSGEASILGYSAFTEQEKIRQSIGYMSQKFSLFDDLTVRENLEFFGTLYGLSGRTLAHKIKETIDAAGLSGKDKMLTASLPAGIKQRLALGTAVIHEPDVLFLDEPTSGVDPSARQEFWKLIYSFSQAGKTVFVTTHYMDEAEHCGRIALIIAGKIMALDTPHNLKANLPCTVYAIESDDFSSLFKKASALDIILEKALFGREIHLLVKPGSDRKKLIESFLRKNTRALWKIRKVPPTLEDVFVLNTRSAVQ